MNRIIFSLIITLTVFTTQAQEPMSILFIGNSFTHMNAMPKQYDKLAKSLDQKMTVEMDAKSNHTLKMHCARPELFEKINSRKWDYVVIQPFSRELIFDMDSINEATVPYLQQLIDSVRLKNPCTNILLYETWGYKNGFAERTDTDTFDEMAMKLENGFRYISDTFDLPIVPVGMVWREIANKHPEINLYDADGSHPSPIGSYLVACTFYTSIFKKGLDGDIHETYPVEQVKTIHEVVYNYVLSNLESCKLNVNSFFVVKTANSPSSKKYKISCKANYPKADSLIWDFGDGSKSKYNNVNHSYKNPGKYTVKLTVHDTCGVRVYNQNLTFTAPPAPKPKSKTKKTPAAPAKKP